MQRENITETIDFLDQVKAYFLNQQCLYGDDLYLDCDFKSLTLSESERKRNKLLDLFFQVRDCQNCELAKQRKKFVFGSGNSASRIMLISEAPGFNEDLQGKPFIGEAGKLLDKILAAINLTREEIFITNVVKCHPPGNRDPLPEEIAACEPILSKQIEIIKPEFILILGRVAAHSLLKTTKPLRQLRGQVVDLFGAKAVVTYHPAALLRNPGLKRGTWEDVQIFQKLYE